MARQKMIFIMSFMIIGRFVFGQTNTEKYNNLIKKADSFYRTKNYKASVTTYSQAFKLIHWNPPINDKYNVACVLALAEMPDSAFYYLNTLASSMGYYKIEQITMEHDLNSLHKDKRWKKLLEIINNNIEKKEAKLNKPLIKQLDSIYTEDQKYREKITEIEKKYGFDSKEIKDLWKKIKENDSINLIQVETIIEKYGWLGVDVIGEQGNATLFFVIQHSNQQTQEKYLPIMREAMKNGNAKPAAFALLEDRVALGQGKKQIYGSQIRQDSTGKYSIAPIQDEINVDKRRAEVGLETLEEYVKPFGIVYKENSTKKKTSLKFSNNDFATAMEIRDSIISPLNVGVGRGLQLDFKANEAFKEENSAWFKLTINTDTILIFDIVPDDLKDDYDFIVFKCPNDDCINNIRTNKLKPDRWCFSANYAKNGSTGLSEYATEKYVGAGYANGYASGLPVKAGETCYLMVNFSNNYSYFPKGFTLYFYNYWPQKPVALKTARVKTKAIILESVLFETNKTVLLKESFVALDKLVHQLNANKTMKIEITGHTDNIGNEIDNQKLSEDRAKAVVDYLVSKKINRNSLLYKGLGSIKPIAPNNTEDGRKKNRRVEFLILKQ